MTKRLIRPAILTLAAAVLLAAPLQAAMGSDDKEETRRFGVAKPVARPAGTIRMASYNALNLFDDKDDPALSGRNDDADDTKPIGEREALARTILAIDADIVALQEIESKEALVWFRDTHLAGAGYDHIVSLDAGDGRGIENAVLSRFPLENPEIWPNIELGGVHPELWGNRRNYSAGQPLLIRRSPLRVTAVVPASDEAGKPYKLTLFVVHHKSGREAGYWREAEAAKVVELVGSFEDQHAGANIVILGDFNCRKDDPPYKTYMGAGLTDAFEGKSGPDPVWVTHESGRTIDHVLLNEAVVHEYVPTTRFVLGTPARPEGSDWRSTAAPEGYASDHYPVVIDLIPRDR